jgi:protein-S-isoprenylcysteine O-methyltransferase Ste14/pimeloyl-ACP methyl ester carboxylesterase
MRIPRLARALLAFSALPGLVAFVAPLLLGWPEIGGGSFRTIALVPLLAGAALLLWCVRDFYVSGRGTLAPWDPPRNLVVAGLYRRSRNPMYIAVTLVLVGWAIGFRSSTLWLYALVVLIAFHVRVVYGEEPWLARTHTKEWDRYAARVPRWLFPNRKALLLSLAGLAVLLALTGLVYEAYADARDARRFPPPGQLVDVGGRRLHLICIGEGEPVVMFEPSGFGSALSSTQARERIATRSQTCSYDRMGMGWSDAGAAVISSAELARELAVLQDRAKLRQPFILVAASIGGLTAEMFARQYPERVAGLVFVDAASSEFFAPAVPSLHIARVLACVAGASAQFGLIRLLDPFGLGEEESEAGERGAAITYGARLWGTLCAIVRGIPASAREFSEAPPLPADVPLIVLSADSDRDYLSGFAGLAARMRPVRISGHQALAKRSTRGSWRLVPDSTHLIGNSQPDAVADAVFAILDGDRPN